MARDRQRAKQRRRRQPGASGGSPAGSARARARDADADPEVQPEPIPDTVFPQRGAVQPVEGEETVEFSDEEAVEAAPDQLDPAVTEEREEHAHRRERRRRGGIITFLGHVVDELRRVQWPDRAHTAQGTAVVLGFVVIAGSYLGLLDAIWKPLIEAIL